MEFSLNINFLGILFCILSKCLCDNINSDNMLLLSSDMDVNNKDTVDSRNLKTYKKCCPLNQGLLRTTNQSLVTYECTNAYDENADIIFDTILKYPLASFKVVRPLSKVVIGFPEQCTAEQYFQKEIASLNAMSDDDCMDKVFIEATPDHFEVGNGSVIVLGCSTPQQSELITIPIFRSFTKCCTDNMVFDTESNICVPRNISEPDEFFSTLSNLLPKDFDALDLKYGLRTCGTPNYALHYTSKTFEFKLDGKNLDLIKGSKRLHFNEGDFCVDYNLKKELVARSCKPNCEDGVCITKCCPEGQIYKFANNKCNGQRPVCGLSTEYGFSPKFYNLEDIKHPIPTDPPDVLGIRYKESCPKNKYILNPSNPKDIGYVSVQKGNLVLPRAEHPHGHDFCMEAVDSPCPDKPKGSYFFVCFPVPIEKSDSFKTKMRFYSVGFVISSVFLAATLLVYIVLPPLQNLHGRILMFYVAALLVAYSCLARIQWPLVPLTTHCMTLGYSVYFSFMVAFSWLNIMCFDIWLTFGNTRSIQVTKQNIKDLKKLLLFCIYTFGFPILLTTIVYLLDVYNVTVLDPDMGKSSCWFNTEVTRKPFIILFILPAGIQIFCNIVLFILTALHCNKVKSEIHRMQASSQGEKCKRRFMADKAMFSMNMKLFIVMGVTWTMEIISAFDTQNDPIWYIPDIINAFHGIPIFCILVLKRKVYRLLRKRLGIDKSPHGKSETSRGTSSTGYSVTSSSQRYSMKHVSIDSTTKAMLTNGK